MKDYNNQNGGVTSPPCLQRVAVVHPSGNTTAVVFDELPNIDRKTLNRRILRAWKCLRPDKPEIEQCCFVTPPRDPKAIARVEMFGGEFCGNATRSVAWLIKEGKNSGGKIEVSGVSHPLEFSIRSGVVSIEMPLPIGRKFVRPVQEGTLVELDGITQLVVIAADARKRQSPRQLLRTLLNENKYDLTSRSCVGVSYYNPKSASAKFCVWVKEVNTVFDETACGSGTCAIGVTLATVLGSSTSLSVVQPSGATINTTAVYQSGEVVKSKISGKIAKLYDGKLELQKKR